MDQLPDRASGVGAVSGCDVALDADLVAGVLGHPGGAPVLYSRDVGFRSRHEGSVSEPGQRHGAPSAL
jgi:hypothetical protein